METQEMCLSLVRSETEEAIIQTLQQIGYWDDPKHWKNFGDDENNYSVIGNQQSRPESAIVEKLINSVDATLMRECLIRGINPENGQAPASINAAMTQFFGVFNGDLGSLDSTTRSKLADGIGLIATGEKMNPNYIIYDKGEGQTPAMLPNTLLSLHKSNKLRIPFVQGKYNMGGTGVFRFCGENNIQVMLSKRNPEIAKLEDDSTKNEWGFTVIRRENPINGAKSSHYSYLAPNDKILSFEANDLPILPSKYPNAYGKPFKSGTYIKLFGYKIGSGLRSNIQFDLYNKLSTLIPRIALPVKLYERRPNYKAHTYETVISGLLTRLREDRGDNIEQGFPSTGFFKTDGQKLHYSIYVFKKDAYDKYAANEGVLFTINGQTHGHLTKSFFNTKSVGMNYLAESLLIILDCSDIDGRSREDLFMNSRDRLSNCALKMSIEEELADLITHHQGLRELKERRRAEEVDKLLSDNKPLTEILQKIIFASPTLSRILGMGVRLHTPFNENGEQKVLPVFEGKKFPTFFKLVKKYDEKSPKPVHIGSKFRIEFTTDAENTYFDRQHDVGSFNIQIIGEDGQFDYMDSLDMAAQNVSMNLWNGVAYLNMAMDVNEVGKLLFVRCQINDISRTIPLANDFVIRIEPAANKNQQYDKKSSNNNSEAKDTSSKLALPNIVEITRYGVDGRHSWAEQGFNKDSALKVKGSEEDGYDYFINVDNASILQEMHGSKPADIKTKQMKYKFGLVLIGMSLLHDHKLKQLDEFSEETENVFDLIERVSTAVSPIIVPMIDGLGEMSSVSDMQMAVMV